MKITNEDNMELMARYEDNHFDLAIVDPPYGIIASGGQKGGVSEKYKNRAYTNGSIDDWDIKPNKQYFKEILHVYEYQH